MLRYHGTSGTYLDPVVPSGSGLSLPVGILIGPDGNLYVASFSNNKVDWFDPTTATLLGDFVTGGSGGINCPNFMLMRPPPTPAIPVPGILAEGENVTVSWRTDAVGWSRQSTSALDPRPAWSKVVHPLSKGGGRFEMTLQRTNGARFFRLIRS